MTFNESHLLVEAVIVPNTKGFLKKMDTIRNEKLTFVYPFYSNEEELLSIINNIFNQSGVFFVKDNNSQGMQAITTKDGDIKIYINKNLYNVFTDDNRYRKFKQWFKNVITHELIHREQAKRIDWSKFKFTKHKTKTDYFKNKQELMAYARTIIDELFIKLKTYKKVIHFLRQPKRDVSELFDIYVEEVGDDKETINKLYKYLYEYLIKMDR